MIKIKIIFLFLLIISYQGIFSVEPISIGGNCFPAGAMRDLNVRKSAYPFDWMFSSFESIIQAFEGSFEHFLNPEDLHIGHPNDRIVDYYGLEYVHDFPTIQSNAALHEGQTHEQKEIRSDWMNFIDPIKEKYNRRIQRLKDCLQGTEEVIFFRYDYVPLNRQLIIKLRDIIQTKYPQLKFSIITIEAYSNTFQKWKYENCENFCIPEGHEYLTQWQSIFNAFQIIPTRFNFTPVDDSGCCDKSCLK